MPPAVARYPHGRERLDGADAERVSRGTFDSGQGLARLLDLHVHRRQGLDPAFDAPRQPVHRRPAAAADTEKKAQADQQGPEPRAPQQDAHPCGRRRRIALDGTQRAPCGGAQALAKPLELARGRLLDLPEVGLQPAPEPLGQVVRVGSHVRIALLSAATGLQVVGSQRRQVVPALARHLQAHLLQGGDDIGPVPYRARHARAGSLGSGRGGRARVRARPAAAPPRRRRGARVAAPAPGPGRPARSNPVRR